MLVPAYVLVHKTIFFLRSRHVVTGVIFFNTLSCNMSVRDPVIIGVKTKTWSPCLVFSIFCQTIIMLLCILLCIFLCGSYGVVIV